MGLVVSDFWNHRTVSELATEQGLSAPPDLDELVIKGATDEELDAFLDALTLIEPNPAPS